MASLAELRAQLANLNRRTTKNPDVWKPKDEHKVRLLRNPHSEDPFTQVAFHYNVGDAREILCPKVNFGEDCVICDFAEQLKSFNDENGKKKNDEAKKFDWDIFKKIQVNVKVAVPMIERTDEGKSNSAPAWWVLTSNQSQQIIGVCAEADRVRACGIDPADDEKVLGAIFNTDKAFDFEVSFAKPGEKNNNKTFTQVTIKPAYLPGPLTGNKEKDKELIKQIKPFREVFPKVPSSEVESALKKFIGGGMKVENNEPEKKDEKYAKKGEKAEKAGTRTVDESFGELLDNK